MYTYNYFCFGHDLSKDKNLIDRLYEWDIDHSKMINGNEYTLRFHYHGGKCGDDPHSCVLGVVITDDDNNSNYINEVRNVREVQYVLDYIEFINDLFTILKQDCDSDAFEGNDKEDFKKLVDDLSVFLRDNVPGFYTVEVSS